MSTVSIEKTDADGGPFLNALGAFPALNRFSRRARVISSIGSGVTERVGRSDEGARASVDVAAGEAIHDVKLERGSGDGWKLMLSP